ncbi:hypothetical protein [Amycolatopsis sp. lyj-23]
MTFSVDDLKLTISQAQQAIDGNSAKKPTEGQSCLVIHRRRN